MSECDVTGFNQRDYLGSSLAQDPSLKRTNSYNSDPVRGQAGQAFYLGIGVQRRTGGTS